MTRRYPLALIVIVLASVLLLGSCAPDSATKITYRYFPTSVAS